jgi:hypothetical protein
MNRRKERDSRTTWRRLSPRYIKVVVTLISAFILLNATIYILVNYIIYPTRSRLTTKASTSTIPTTTTTMKTTTTSSFSKLSFEEMIK